MEATAAEACPRGLRYALAAPASPSRLGFACFALAACATRLRLGLLPHNLALPAHNNQTATQQPQKLLRQRCCLSAAAVAAGSSSGGSCGGIGCGGGSGSISISVSGNGGSGGGCSSSSWSGSSSNSGGSGVVGGNVSSSGDIGRQKKRQQRHQRRWQGQRRQQRHGRGAGAAQQRWLDDGSRGQWLRRTAAEGGLVKTDKSKRYLFSFGGKLLTDEKLPPLFSRSIFNPTHHFLCFCLSSLCSNGLGWKMLLKEVVGSIWLIYCQKSTLRYINTITNILLWWSRTTYNATIDIL
jgi:hypothetical protein